VLRAAFTETFPNVELRCENGLYRDNIDKRFRAIAAQALR
jgi:hypothetical protein